MTGVMNPVAGEGRLYWSMNAGSVVFPSASPGAVLIVNSRSGPTGVETSAIVDTNPKSHIPFVGSSSYTKTRSPGPMCGGSFSARTFSPSKLTMGHGSTPRGTRIEITNDLDSFGPPSGGVEVRIHIWRREGRKLGRQSRSGNEEIAADLIQSVTSLRLQIGSLELHLCRSKTSRQQRKDGCHDDDGDGHGDHDFHEGESLRRASTVRRP